MSEPMPGTKAADEFSTIAARLKEIEAEKARAREAARDTSE